MKCTLDETGLLRSLYFGGKEQLAEKQPPLFRLALREQDGTLEVYDATMASDCKKSEAEWKYSGFPEDVTVTISCIEKANTLNWRISIENRTNAALEYTDFPLVTFCGTLEDNGGTGSVLFPYNEGVLIKDGRRKSVMTEPIYPSCGSYAMFPNMLFSQFVAYISGGSGLYMGVHDPARGLKSLDFCCSEAGVEFRTRIFTGCNFGENYKQPFDTVWQTFDGDWMDAAALYKEWFLSEIPKDLYRCSENTSLPEWYRDSPVVITYPVRGQHDMDVMMPNKLFPYQNALPYVNELAQKFGTKILVLLIHWEGTAPWAPPFVWPPFGGEAMFDDFAKKLHEKGHLLGVYCSGIGWTEQSNLIADYETKEIFQKRNLQSAMCLAPDGSLPKSNICTGQRQGYDLCPATSKAQEVLSEALSPLFDDDVDYIQVLDQNHGGGMYLCYGRSHGHPPTPGTWMTATMQKVLTEWKNACPNTLLGCESAAAEAFLPQLALSDNRYELNYFLGQPVPLYAFLFHEYLHNFMGNQVCSPLSFDTDSLCCRMAYSFAAGDFLTLVLNDEGEVMPRWGMRDFSVKPNRDTVLMFTAQLTRFRKAYQKLFNDAIMIRPFAYQCETISFDMADLPPYKSPTIISTAWELDGKKYQLFVNFTGEAQPVTVSVPAGDLFTFGPLPQNQKPLTEKRFIIDPYTPIMLQN